MGIIVIKPANEKNFTDIEYKNLTFVFDRYGMMYSENNRLIIEHITDKDEFISKSSKIDINVPVVYYFESVTDRKDMQPYYDERAEVGCCYDNCEFLRLNKEDGLSTVEETVFKRLYIPNVLAGYKIGSANFNKAVFSTYGQYTKIALMDNTGKIFTYGKFINHGGKIISNASFEFFEGLCVHIDHTYLDNDIFEFLEL